MRLWNFCVPYILGQLSFFFKDIPYPPIFYSIFDSINKQCRILIPPEFREMIFYTQDLPYWKSKRGYLKILYRSIFIKSYLKSFKIHSGFAISYDALQAVLSRDEQKKKKKVNFRDMSRHGLQDAWNKLYC